MGPVKGPSNGTEGYIMRVSNGFSKGLVMLSIMRMNGHVNACRMIAEMMPDVCA